jgi:hypothetical protein
MGINYRVTERKDHMTNYNKTLLVRVNEVLHYIWDPIGVFNEPAARDEYDSYAMQVFSLLIKNSNVSEITEFLTKTSVDRMGLLKNVEHDQKVAEILMAWKDHLGDEI